jgi:hypothetical protein
MRHPVLCAVLSLSFVSAASAQDPCGTWSDIPIPTPPTSTHTVVEDVAALSLNDAWAVGRQYVPVPGGAETQTLAYHWNGAAWTIVPTPSPSPYVGGGWCELQAVEAISANDVWAAGQQRIQGSGPYPYVGTHVMVQRWNGTQWSVAPSTPLIDGSGDFVDDIEIVAPNDIWFVGDWMEIPPSGPALKSALAMRWNGSSFEVHPTPYFDLQYGHGLTAASALATDDVWAVGGGHDVDYANHSYIVHWNGSQWQHRPGPLVGYSQRLYDVQALSPTEVYAIGDFEDSSGYHGLFLRWNGSSWTRLPDPPVGGGSLHAFSSNRIYAGGGGIGLWNGASWSTVATFPNVGFPSIVALEPIGPCSLWGVGRKFENSTILPLSVRLDPGTGTSYCTTSPNSVGPGALISANGSSSISANDLVLLAGGAPPFRSGIFFYGDQQVSFPFGDGVRCVAGLTVRTPLVSTDVNGSASRALVYSGTPIDAGEAWNFQFWYRDPVGGGVGFNLSNALRVVFAP